MKMSCHSGCTLCIVCCQVPALHVDNMIYQAVDNGDRLYPSEKYIEVLHASGEILYLVRTLLKCKLLAFL